MCSKSFNLIPIAFCSYVLCYKGKYYICTPERGYACLFVLFVLRGCLFLFSFGLVLAFRGICCGICVEERKRERKRAM